MRRVFRPSCTDRCERERRVPGSSLSARSWVFRRRDRDVFERDLGGSVSLLGGRGVRKHIQPNCWDAWEAITSVEEWRRERTERGEAS